MTLPRTPFNLLSSPEVSTSAPTPQFTENDKLKNTVLETILPNQIFDTVNPTTGTTDFDAISRMVEEKVDMYSKSVIISSIPSAAALSVIPKLPVITIPSPAEIKKYILMKIEEKKRRQQTQTLRAQMLAATTEERPFTNRRELQSSAGNRIHRTL
jgi:hypothetical protein